MNFGIVLPTDVNGAGGANYEDLLRVGVLAEELGYDFATVSHHRQDPGFPSAPFVLLGALAARTGTLRLGTNIVILPVMHPLQVAEDVATIDRISNGRVYLGPGVGYRRHEFEPAGVEFERRGKRMEEALEILRLVWSGENVSYSGTEFAFEGVTVQPRPIQRPCPPIWVGAQVPRTVERAARLGDGWTTDSKATVTDIAELANLYRATAAADSDPRPRTICVTRDVALARTRREIEEVWLPEALRRYVAYWDMGVRWPDDKRIAERAKAGERISLDEFAHDRFLYGTPDDVVEQIERCHELIGCDGMLIRLGYETTFRDDQLRHFAAEVLPAFR